MECEIPKGESQQNANDTEDVNSSILDGINKPTNESEQSNIEKNTCQSPIENTTYNREIRKENDKISSLHNAVKVDGHRR